MRAAGEVGCPKVAPLTVFSGLKRICAARDGGTEGSALGGPKIASQIRPACVGPKTSDGEWHNPLSALAAHRRVGHIGLDRRRGRVAEGGGLLNRYRVVKPYRGFESLRLRQPSQFALWICRSARLLTSLLKRCRASMRVPAHREEIHAQKSLGMIGFEAVPLIEVRLIGRARKLPVKFLDHRRIVKWFEGQE